MTVALDETDSPTLAVEEGGIHAAEGLIIARYMMFTQVYFQHTRRAYDFHLKETMKSLLKEECGKEAFPPPATKESTKRYLEWDDRRVLGLIHEGKGGIHGEIIRKRGHYRKVYQTPESPSESDLESFECLSSKLGDFNVFVDVASSSWYKFDTAEIPILLRVTVSNEELTVLSLLSSIVRGLKTVSQRRIYAPYKRRDEVGEYIRKLRSGECRV